MYPYRCTEQQLGDALLRITEAGDTLLHAIHKGGRDWMLICRKAGPRQAVLDDLLDELLDIKAAIREADVANGKAAL